VICWGKGKYFYSNDKHFSALFLLLLLMKLLQILFLLLVLFLLFLYFGRSPEGRAFRSISRPKSLENLRLREYRRRSFGRRLS
jgi:hypothetical protein